MKLLPLELLDQRQDAKNRREGFLTFNGWLVRDRAVKKGQKATRWSSKGAALFHETQTDWIGQQFGDPSDFDSEQEEIFSAMEFLND